MYPHSVPQHANDFPGFQPVPLNNELAQNDDWDDWEEQEEQGHWAFPQANVPQPQPPQQQMEMLVLQEDGAPNSSITTTVSLSDGIWSNTHTASEEVNQGAQINPLGMGLQSILIAYQVDGEEEDFLQDYANLANIE